ncbi:hypothetical protein PGTUg99_014136 [Puccinia graminis f. sp. tritici]|uniref:Uncharacterized protein n=1 Tax=Puccinia graminis f. sp. tritici TaxID=56615 RepID=A0A5B0M5J7_PUCGR|nr:hypothetical protein PGTUg99_014136 [Puccinia graminis f. sp. tritici]
MNKCRQAAASLPGNRGQANVAGSSRPWGFTPPAMKHPQFFVGAVRFKPTEFVPSSILSPALGRSPEKPGGENLIPNSFPHHQQPFCSLRIVLTQSQTTPPDLVKVDPTPK